MVGIWAPRPAKGWAVLSGAPGVFSSAILVWGPVPFCPPAGVSRTNHARFFAPTLCTWNGPGLPTWAAPETRLGCFPQWYIHGYHWSGGPPGGWGGPYMINQNWVWELLWGSRSFPPGAVGGVVWGVVGVGAGSCYAAPWASQLGCARTPIGCTTWVQILHSAEEHNLSPFDLNITCLCQSIEINNNKYVYRQSQVRKSTDSGVKWAECSLIIGTGCRVQVLAWSSVTQSVCQRAFSLLAIWSLGSRVRILHSAEEHSLSPFDLNIACLCHSIEINNNNYVYNQSQVQKSTDSGVKWAECSLIIGTGCPVQVFSLILDSSVCLSGSIQSAGDLAHGARVQILHSAVEHNLSPFDLNIACLCQSIEINNNKYVYRQSQVRKSTDSGVKWAECSLIIGTGCRVQVFSLILDSSVGLSASIQSAGDLVSGAPGSNPAFSRGTQLVSFRFEYCLPVPEHQY